ncbi:MAG TPA: Na-translocating system protein MpsC family protein, partial [Solirubrobacterales bacterium]|nr:Na-translocating system protein MpsC family protein [Solirubrobacterales bacterium]
MAEDPPVAPSPEALEAERGGSAVAAISREVVHVHAEFYGRGPTKAKTIWRDEIVCCVLEDIFTKAEQMLVAGGRFEEVRSHRTAFQDQVEPLFRAGVEAITHRP